MLLASRCTSVIGIDVSAEALSRAAAAQSCSNLHPIVGDVMTYPFPAAGFDFIATVATLHHLPLEAGLIRLTALLKPGGVLTVIGLYRLSSVTDFACTALATPLGWILRGFQRALPMRAPMRRPEHSLEELRSATKRLLPGAQFKRLLFLRYSIVWSKPH